MSTSALDDRRVPPHRTTREGDPAGDVFVGRKRELGELLRALRESGSERGRAFMLVGEPGIGKTRLAAEFTARARAEGALVLWGRAWEGGGVPVYWPWVQLIRSYAGSCSDAQLATALGPGASYVAQLVPEIRQRMSDLGSPPASLEPQSARFYLFDAVAQFLKRLAGRQRLALVFDDLHVVDLPSALLLQFVVRDLVSSGIIVVGTYREAELGRRVPLSEILGEVACDSHHLPLRGLNEAEVDRLARQAFGVTPARSLIASIYWATDGNPFLVDEVLHLLVGERRLDDAARVSPERLGIPQGVREALRLRKAQLAEGARRVLATAAVIGREFDVALLEHACDEPADEIAHALVHASDLAMVSAVAGVVGGFAFCHALIRDALYDDVAPADRVRLHRRLGAAIEHLHAGNLDGHLAELAHHFVAAAPGGDAARAVHYVKRAAAQACSQLAYEEAVAHLERALRILSVAGIGGGERCELLLALGTAYDAAGELTEARRIFHEAARIAGEIGAPSLLARAALGFGEQWTAKFTCSIFEVSHTQLLEQARAALGREDDELRTRLLSRLAMSAAFAGDEARGMSLTKEAVEMARRLDDDATLAYALSARHAVLLGPTHADARLAIAHEMVQQAARVGSRELALRARALRMHDRLEVGDVAGSGEDLTIHARLAEELRDPFDLWLNALCRSTRALFDGRLDESERATIEAVTIAHAVPGQQAAEENVGIAGTLQLFVLARERGWQREVTPIVASFAERYPRIHAWRVMLAALHADLGRRDEAIEVLHDVARDGFASVLRDVCWLGAMCVAAEVCACVGAVSYAEAAYGLLRPFEARLGSIACCGPTASVARYLGILAAALSRRRAARDHFAVALAVHERLGARTWSAHTRFDLASLLLGERRRQDRDEGRTLLQASMASARELGLIVLLEKAERLARTIGESTDPRARASGGVRRLRPPAEDPRREQHAPPPAEYVFRKDGDFWTVAYGGCIAHLREVKGLRHLAQLLRHPARRMHANALVELVDRDPARMDGVIEPGDGEPVLDATAASAYREHLRALRTEIDDAAATADGEREARLRAECEFVTSELTAALGLGGRPRRTGSTAERARLNVTRAIKTGMARIAVHHPELARHLQSTVRTGTFCVYVPDPRLPIDWQL